MGKNNMKLENAERKNQHYRLYKAKKQWLTACETVLITVGAVTAVGTTVHAATTDSNGAVTNDELVTSGGEQNTSATTVKLPQSGTASSVSSATSTSAGISNDVAKSNTASSASLTVNSATNASSTVNSASAKPAANSSATVASPVEATSANSNKNTVDVLSSATNSEVSNSTVEQVNTVALRSNEKGTADPAASLATEQRTQTIEYQDTDEDNKVVSIPSTETSVTTKVTGDTGTTIQTSTLVLPTNYELSDSAPTSFTINGGTTVIALKHKLKKGASTSRSVTVVTKTLDTNEDVADDGQLVRTRCVIYTDLVTGEKIYKINPTFTAGRFVDGVWSVRPANSWTSTSDLEHVTLHITPSSDLASVSKDGKTYHPAYAVDATTTKSSDGTINYTFPVGTYTTTLYYIPEGDALQDYEFVDDDENGAQVGDTVHIYGTIGSTVNTNLTLPDNYELASGQTLPTSVTIADDASVVKIHLVHKTESLNHTSTIPTGAKTSDGANVTASDFSKNVTRTINFTFPTNYTPDPTWVSQTGYDASTGSIIQSSQFNRTGTYDYVTKIVTFNNDWAPTSATEAAVTIPTIDNYNAKITEGGTNVTGIPETTVTNSSADTIYSVTYKDNLVTQTYQFVDDDDNGAQVGNEVTVSGKTGASVDTGLTIPANYELASGQTLPTTVTLTDDATTVVIHLVHRLATTSDTSLDPATMTQTRTATVNYVYGAGTNKGQQAADSSVLDTYYTRTATKDLVTGKVVTSAVATNHKLTNGGYGNWKWDNSYSENGFNNGYKVVSGTWTTPSTWGAVIAKVPTLTGYTAMTTGDWEYITDANGNKVYSSVPANEFTFPTYDGTQTSDGTKSSISYTDEANVYEATPTHTVYFVPTTEETTRTATVNYEYLNADGTVGTSAHAASQLDVYYTRTISGYSVAGGAQYGDWTFDSSYNEDGFTNGYKVVAGTWTTTDGITATDPTVDGYTAIDQGDWSDNTAANKFDTPTTNSFTDQATTYGSKAEHTVYYAPNQNQTRVVTVNYKYINADESVGDDAYAPAKLDVYFTRTANSYSLTNHAITYGEYFWNQTQGDKTTPGYTVISAPAGTSWINVANAGNASIGAPVPSNATKDGVTYDAVYNSSNPTENNSEWISSPLADSNTVFTNQNDPTWYNRPSRTIYYVADSMLNRSVTRTINIYQPGATTPTSTVVQQAAFSRTAYINDAMSGVAYNDWNPASASWDEYAKANYDNLSGYTPVITIDGQAATSIPAKDNVTVDTADSVVNIKYVQNVPT